MRPIRSFLCGLALIMLLSNSLWAAAIDSWTTVPADTIASFNGASAAYWHTLEVQQESYGDIIHFWTADTSSSPYWNSSKDCSDTDTTPSLANNATINQNAAHNGTNGLDVSECGTYDNQHAAFYEFEHTASSLRVGFWIYIVDDGNFAFLDLNPAFLVLFANDLGGGIGIQIKHIPSSTTWTSNGAGMSINNWYFVEVAFDRAASRIKAFVNGNTVINASYSWSEISADRILVGSLTTYSLGLYIDNVIVSSDPGRNLYAIRNLEAKPTGACDGS